MHLVSTGLPHHSNALLAYTFFCPTLDFVPRKVSIYMKNSDMLVMCHLNLQTRSGNEFSPWAMGPTLRTIVPLPSADCKFEDLVREAVIKENELGDDDTEGFALDAITAPPLPSLAPPEAKQPLFSQPGPLAPYPPHPPAREVPKYLHGSTEDCLRKKRGHTKRAIQRMEAKRAAPHGFYAVKPAVLNHHVRPAIAINSNLNTSKLKPTKNSWTGVRDKGGYKRVFTLNEMVGEGSIFKFRLEQWNGW